ncbi:hypothetical protein K488DRAFT_85334 [Vararia minispora EC-137]|uniref:Uncharacterized protein n=1 Tax=Vararia minispora EC-137 TaxID=1314806 RepID=A0ACB8QNC8_9AGAM|nr:hypothetical protein K488DRAFT_85334 [Vararia minispora EC-137]
MSSPIDIRLSFGQVLIGVILGSLFYGIILLQAGLYVGTKRANSTRNTFLVIILVSVDDANDGSQRSDLFSSVLETFAWILEVYCVWWYFVLNYANPAALRSLNWSLTLDPFITYTIVLIGQIFFIEKIWILGKSWFLGIFMTFLAFSGWGTGIGIGILKWVIVNERNFTRTAHERAHSFVQQTTHSAAITNINYYEKVSETLLELLIAICMIFLLRKMRTGLRDSDRVVNNLIIFMLTRGIVVCVVQIVYTGLSINATFRGNLIWITPHFCIGKFATNAVLASLNVRELVQAGFNRKRFSAPALDQSVIEIHYGRTSGPAPASMEPIAFGQMRSDISTQSGGGRDKSDRD